MDKHNLSPGMEAVIPSLPLLLATTLLQVLQLINKSLFPFPFAAMLEASVMELRGLIPRRCVG